VAVAPQLVAAVVSIVVAATDTRIVWKTKLIPDKTRDEVLLDTSRKPVRCTENYIYIYISFLILREHRNVNKKL
jgi:hypothetical protein